MGTAWGLVLEGLGTALTAIAELLAPVAGAWAWGLAIIALTVVVRIALLPLGVVQARTVRARRRLAPDVARITHRYDTSARLRARDPDRYVRNLRRQQEALRDLHREHGVRPAAGLLVALGQSPVLFALYRMLTSPEIVPALVGAPFLLVESLSLSVVAGAGIGGVLLALLAGVTTWYAHRQVTRDAPAPAGGPRPEVLGVAMAGVLTAVAATLPVGVLLYWSTSGALIIAQQAVLLR